MHRIERVWLWSWSNRSASRRCCGKVSVHHPLKYMMLYLLPYLLAVAAALLSLSLFEGPPLTNTTESVYRGEHASRC